MNGNDKKIEQILTKKMQDASDVLDFELALFYKQKLDVLDKLIRKQVTALPKDFNLDVFSVASNGLNTVVAVLFIRAGKLVGGDKQVIIDVTFDKQVALYNFITQYYELVKFVPDEVITSIAMEDSEVLEQYLGIICGRKVRVLTPMQGVRKQLCDMADNNSNDYLEKSISITERKDNMTIGAIIQLQEFLNLQNMPTRIECYDVSHISGTQKVASMVVFSNGESDKAHYRKFKIQTVEGNNDFASLQETLRRRLTRLVAKEEKDESFGATPDLIVIDGGKGQLSSVMQIFEEFGLKNMNVISLAEREEEVYIPHQMSPIIFPKDSYALRLLQRIRDEAHR
ncbi:MAG: UvrB/UvrC motif-containing protein, partial [Clostridia bacterium]